MQKGIVFGIDQSFSSTGLSIKEIYSGDNIELTILTTSKDMDWFDRSSALSKGILDLAEGYNDAVLTLEGLPFGNLPGNSGKNLAGLQFVIITAWRDAVGSGKDFIVTPTSLKKFATGSGKASKDEMVASLPEDVRDRVQSQPKSKGRYDLADSWWLSEYYRQVLHNE